MPDLTILQGDVREVLPGLGSESVHCVVTSPPYWGLRSYLPKGHVLKGREMGQERTPEEYVEGMVGVFREVRRVLRRDGTVWLNLGDSWAAAASGRPQSGMKALSDKYSPRKVPRERHKYQDSAATPARPLAPGLKAKDLVGIPWRVALALQADGWYLRQEIIWHKPNPMPESVRDRCTRAHETVFIFSKSGSALLWRHERTRQWVEQRPPADFVWVDRECGGEVRESPGDWRTATFLDGEGKRQRKWRRKDLWEGFDYFYDAEAIAEPLSSASVERLSQEGYEEQEGSVRANGGAKTNGKMKAVYAGSAKPYTGKATKDFDSGGAQDASAVKARIVDRILSGEMVTRNKRSVWTVGTAPFKEAHFATFPPELIRPCILAGCPAGGVVLDTFGGSGTTGAVALECGRSAVLVELNPEYVPMMGRRCAVTPGLGI